MDNFDIGSIKLFVEKIYDEKQSEKNDILYILNNPEYMDNLVRKINRDTYVFDNIGNSNIQDNKLALLYKIVNNYACDNGLYPVINGNHSVYYIEYKNEIFSIFKRKSDYDVVYGCYINYFSKDRLPYCINFDDIKNNRIITVDRIGRGLIAELSETIAKLHDEGFPLHFLQQLSDNIIENIALKEAKEEDKSK